MVAAGGGSRCYYRSYDWTRVNVLSKRQSRTAWLGSGPPEKLGLKKIQTDLDANNSQVTHTTDFGS